MGEGLADAQLEKSRKEVCVSVNVKLMSFLMPMEIAILVDQIKSFPMEYVFAQLDIVLIVVECVHFLVLKANSPSKEDVQFVP